MKLPLVLLKFPSTRNSSLTSPSHSTTHNQYSSPIQRLPKFLLLSAHRNRSTSTWIWHSTTTLPTTNARDNNAWWYAPQKTTTPARIEQIMSNPDIIIMIRLVQVQLLQLLLILNQMKVRWWWHRRGFLLLVQHVQISVAELVMESDHGTSHRYGHRTDTTYCNPRWQPIAQW